MEKELWLTMQDGAEIYMKKWFNPDHKPKAIVQLAHGMVEHINRYDDLASYLIENDIVVFGNDHRGHGKTGERHGVLGYLSDKNGFTKTMEDLFTITNHIKNEYPDTPLFLLGHSMGSFLARNYIQEHSNAIDGVILSGTGYYQKATLFVGGKIASTLSPKKPSKLMNAITFNSYNKRITEKKTGFDWLTRDEKIGQKYMDDPFCGFVPTARFFVDLMDGLLLIHNEKRNSQIRTSLPILMISGDADPVGNYAKGIWKTASMYEKAGLNNILVKLYKDGRHEILNELNKDEVYQDVLQWIEQNIG